jgi:hypothetical protein
LSLAEDWWPNETCRLIINFNQEIILKEVIMLYFKVNLLPDIRLARKHEIQEEGLGVK